MVAHGVLVRIVTNGFLGLSGARRFGIGIIVRFFGRIQGFYEACYFLVYI